MKTLFEFSSEKYPLIHRGKVRDSFRIDPNRRLIVVSDRISAFNKKIKTAIPGKGAVLNGLAAFWFERTRDIIANHLIEVIDPQASVVHEAQPIRIEMVVRGYLAGSMARDYAQGKRLFGDNRLPEGLTLNAALEQPIVTPTTKDDDDTEVNQAQIVEMGLASADLYERMKIKALELFRLGSAYLDECGMVLVDTKYEFGLLDGELILIDEIHTPDSSRFWFRNDYLSNPQGAEQIDKEFVRRWLLANRSAEGEIPLVLPEDVVRETVRRYAQIHEIVTGKAPQLGNEDEPPAERLNRNLAKLDRS